MAIDSIGFNLPISFGSNTAQDLGLMGLGTNPMGNLFADSPTAPLSLDSYVPSGEELSQGVQQFPDFVTPWTPSTPPTDYPFNTEPAPPLGLDPLQFENFPPSQFNIPDPVLDGPAFRDHMLDLPFRTFDI